MRRLWSIRARTAIAFALCSMVLTAGVLVFVNLASVAWAERALIDERTSGTPDGPVQFIEPGGPRVGLDVTVEGEHAELAVVSVVAGSQRVWSVVGVVGAGVLAAGLGWVVSRRMLRPIDRITDIATRISASNLRERIALGGPDDELRRLSQTIDALLDRLETAFEGQRRFVAQASHELRTPLAVQRTAVQVGLHPDADVDEIAATRDELLEQNRRTERLVESLLVLADAERELGDRAEPVPLEAVVHDVVVAAAGQAGHARVRIERSSPADPAPVVLGEPVLIRQLVCNLVDNAVEYNTAGGFVRVSCHPGGLVVENSGPVVPADAAATLVEPFRRCGPDGRHRHSGLGLSIVAAVARAHGWGLRIASRPTGGLRVEVAFDDGDALAS